ncbi:MAG: Gfo/Idh/MocA family oxidoreductase [Deltaproteobacteria bacterium]|nr:Gfo/Idh/MocA family oxidoreductase [Deltaproteobacteria bacterium]
MTRRVEVAVIGCGRMGVHHARVIAHHPKCRLVAVVDAVEAHARAVAIRHGAEARPDVPEGVEAVVVATPTITHAAVALGHLSAGRWCLVEKPLTASASEAATLNHPRLVMGHVERFNPAIRAAGTLKPRFVTSRRLVPFEARSADVCVVKDLMVHDLDLLLHWSEGEVERVDAMGVAVRTEDIDVASVQLRTTDGMQAHLFASRVAEVPERLTRVYEEERTTDLDLLARTACRGTTVMPSADDRDGLTAQWDAFVDAVCGTGPVAVTARDGWRSVALAERIRAVMTEGDEALGLAGRAPPRIAEA